MKLPGDRYDGWTSIAVALTGGYLLVVIWPLTMVLLSSVSDGAEFSLVGFTKFFSSRLYYSTLVNSILVTVCVTVLALIVSFPLAYLMTMFRDRKSVV